MKTIRICLLAIVIMPAVLFAQKPKPAWSISADLIPVYSKLPGLGVGGTIAREWFINRKWSFKAAAEYAHFNGRVVNAFSHDTVTNISLLPVTGNVHYYVHQNIYLGAGLGLIKVLQKDMGVSFTCSPEAGMLLPVHSAKLGLALQWMIVPGIPSFPENGFLKRGGYNFLVLHLRYVF